MMAKVSLLPFLKLFEIGNCKFLQRTDFELNKVGTAQVWARDDDLMFKYNLDPISGPKKFGKFSLERFF